MIANSSSRQRGEMAGRGDPADQRRERPGGAADDDILRRARLQPHGIDQHVEQDRRGKQRRRQPVGRKPHQQHREGAEPDAEVQRRVPLSIRPAGSGRLAVRRIFASMSASYHWLSAPARAGAKGDAQDRGEAERQRRQRRRDQHPAQPGEDHEAHHARLGQREEIAPVGRKRGWSRHVDAGHWHGPIRGWPRPENPSPADD